MEFGTLKSDLLPPTTSIQLADMVAFWNAKDKDKAKDKRVNIYTDFKYAFFILQDDAAIWKEREMLTTEGSSVKHAQDIFAL
jgi:hypothetical protein